MPSHTATSPVFVKTSLTWTLALRRLLAIAVAAVAVLLAYRYPVAPEPLSIGVGVYLLVLLRWPSAWLLVIPALLPVLDLAPWSGRLFFKSFDYFLLATVAGGLWARESGFAALGLSRTAWLLVALLIAQQAASTVIGLFPLQPIDANAFFSLYSHYNSLHMATGYAAAVVFLPMLGQAMERGSPVGRWWTAGMLAGLFTVVASVAWERALFTGIWDFTIPYRPTGLFSSMLTGGAPIDGFLAVTLPFVTGCLLFWRHPFARACGIALFAGGMYALVVSYSRINYAALAAIVAALGLGFALLPRSGARRALVSLKTVTVAAVFIVALLAGVLQGGYMETRFATTWLDTKSRLEHWSAALGTMRDDDLTRALGMGAGTFPRVFAQYRPDGMTPARLVPRNIDGDGFVEFTPSDRMGSLFLRQRFTVTEPGPYRLRMRVRSHADKPAMLLVEFCERNILQFLPECRFERVRFTPVDGQWQEYNVPFDVTGLAERHWYGARPVDISLMNRGLKDSLDVDDVQIFTPSGGQLLVNPDFSAGMDHWFYYSHDHTAWHIKNLWVNAYFEGGYAGLALALILPLYLVVRLLRRIAAGDRMAVVLLASIGGFLTVGLVDTLFDEPRMTLVFLLNAWLTMARSEPEFASDTVAPSQPGATRVQRLSTLFAAQPLWRQALATSVVLAAGSVVAVLLGARHFNITPTQFMVRLAEKAGIESPQVLALLAPAPRYTDHTLDGRLRADHPRILLPTLAQWSGAGVPAVIADRQAADGASGGRFPSACGTGGLPGQVACWLDSGDERIADSAVSAARGSYLELPDADGNAGNAWELAIAYDLLRAYPGFSDGDRVAVEKKIAFALRHLLLMLDSRGPALWGERASLASVAWLCAVVLDAGDPVRDAMVRRAQAHFLEAMRALALSEAWPEGFTQWTNKRAQPMVLAAAAYVNGLEDSAAAADIVEVLRRLGRWYMQATRPDGRIEGFGDEGPRVDLNDQSAPIVDLLVQITRDPALAAYARYLATRNGAPPYHPELAWQYRLFHDSSVAPLPGEGLAAIDGALPSAAVFGRDALNLAYIRSGWDAEATFVSMRAGATMSDNSHFDAGHFTLFKGAPLAVNASSYGSYTAPNRLDYSIRSIAKNTLLVLRPDERVVVGGWLRDNVADGGQRVLEPAATALISVSEWLANLDAGNYLGGGRLTRFAHQEGVYTYLAADLSDAYNTPWHDEGGSGGKVSSVIRELVYLADEDRLLVHDRVRATDPGYTKKWLLHTASRPDVDDLRVIAGDAGNGILASSAERATVSNGRGRLVLQRILPEDAEIRLVGGEDFRYYVETDADERRIDGSNIAEGAVVRPWFDGGDWRIEVQPSQPRVEDEFLLVLTPSIDEFRDEAVTRLVTLSEHVSGVETSACSCVFVSSEKADEVRFELAAGSRTLRVFGLAPGVRLVAEIGPTRHELVVDRGGVAEIALPEHPLWQARIAWN